jgi:peptidoglycan/xylan/chitin deacetylase (PgdA/CDA1 family)
LQNDGINYTQENNSSNGCTDRRKRINRMKTAIIIFVIIFMLIQMIFCIILGLQVNRLQNQVKQLISIHSQYDLAEEDGESSYAYAAVKEVPVVTPTAVPGQEIDKTIEATNSKDQDTSEKSADSDQEAQKSKDEKADSPRTGKYANKKIYLTFDDGPSMYTDDILDILKEYDVKATFFVVGKTDDYSKKMYQRIVEEGHTLGMHSYSHVYSKIYNSVEDFEKDFTKLSKLLYDTTGYKPTIFRFPGGSDNMVNKHGMEEFIRYLNKNDIVYFDWNVLNGDATGTEYTEDQLIDNVLGGVNAWENSIVLMHDSQTKRATVGSLPGLLTVLESEGAQMLPIDKDVTPIQMIKADTIK